MGRRWQPLFLAALKNSDNVRAACQAAAIHRSTAYRARRRDPDFAAKWAEAKDEAFDILLAEARRRAVHGIDSPVYYRGRQTGTRRVVSDRLLIYLLELGMRDREARAEDEDEPSPVVKLVELMRRQAAERRAATEKPPELES